MATETEKTKVCSIFEPTYRSIMTLPSEELRLRMFIALCDYAFDKIEPEFGLENEERFLAALWEQFRLVFVQAEKRSRINAMNGAKGGRPKKAKETYGFSFDNPKKPTDTYTNTYTGEESSTSDFYLIKQWVSAALQIEDSDIFSNDFYPSLLSFIKENELEDKTESYIKFVAEYSKSRSPDDILNYFYSVVTSPGMYETYLNSLKEIL